MAHFIWCGLLIGLLPVSAARAADYSIVSEKADPPKQVAEPIAKELSRNSIQFTQDGNRVCNVWFCKQVPSIGTEAQAKNGLSYHEIAEGTLFGVIEIVKSGFTDYRKQKIPAGVYTLRLGFQPMDGDHMGTAPGNEFLLLSPADADKKTAVIDNNKTLIELSAKTTRSGHPAVMLLFAGKPTSPPQLNKQKDQENHWVINTQVDAIVEKKPYALGVGLTVVGRTP